MIINRTASQTDLVQILNWARDEGWNPGLQDAEAFWQADPEGFFVATDGTELLAAISVVNHSADFAFLGLYITQPSHRGQGVGYALWQHALQHAGSRTIGLDGVPDQQANYAASGFDLFSATTRFTGSIPATRHPQIRMATARDQPALIAMEAATSGTAKPAYLNAWFTEADSRKTLILSERGTITGCCTVRQCASGAKIGPLLAQSADDARSLLSHAASLFGTEMTLDVPDTSAALKALCTTLGLTPGFATARMYRGPAPRVYKDTSSPFFAVTSLELG
ncbi:GNAT family N-acetyltransferase [Shimia marina]|uniref:Acetyltransferase (GNAT) family protein n=1 Tax=Shimia marina TaxID=321267 RepID=A0A0P1EJT9_9RHOB|nr:GNAT family N-acetyltransferase [Shimia marina]CUH50793.1 Acetyltransferase (GNAT) family protein [Shimia marina]SFE66058.1 Acetyltransferase (GNAT) domain-containing protein [Shimia marina]